MNKSINHTEVSEIPLNEQSWLENPLNSYEDEDVSDNNLQQQIEQRLQGKQWRDYLKKYKCSDCNGSQSIQFTRLRVVRHRIRNHMLSPPYNCDFCNEKFPNKPSLQRHVKYHVELSNFVCNICDQTFNKGIAAKQHIISHLLGKLSCSCGFSTRTEFHCHQGGKIYRYRVCL